MRTQYLQEHVPPRIPSQSDDAIFSVCADYLQALGRDDFLQVLCDMYTRDYESVEASIIAQYPDLPSTEVDNAAHATFRRLWALATKIAPCCETPGVFRSQLYKLLRRCARFSTLDEFRKSERRSTILDFQFTSHYKTEHSDLSTDDGVKPEEVHALIERIRQELTELNCPRTIHVLQAMREHNWRCGGLHRRGKEGPSTEQIAALLRNRRIHLSDDDIRMARRRIRAIAERMMEESGWCLGEMVWKNLM